MSPAEILESVRARVREAAGHACGYCQSPQHLVMGKLEIEHIVPRARGGSDEESNLWLSCSLCNRYKGAQTESRDPETNEIVRLYNPRTDDWHQHFAWLSEGVKVTGRTPIGRQASSPSTSTMKSRSKCDATGCWQGGIHQKVKTEATMLLNTC